jgi:membrane protein DedA with SNARE-associated domain
MLESLLASYGYPILLIGTFLEGEAILVMAGVAAHIGYLSLGWVVACGFAGSLLGDQLFFYLGRRRGQAILARRPAWKARSERVLRKLEQHETPLLIGFRFLYGLRSITPFAIGLTNISYMRFTIFNVVSAAAWASAVSLAGYFFGQAIESVFGNIKHYEVELMGGLAGLMLLFWTVRFLRRRRHNHVAAAAERFRTRSS